MSKVLLCYEDFSELMSTQTVLKKVGFDVLPISSEFGLTQQVLSFNPDIVVGYGKGPKVSTVGVGRRLKDMPRWTGSVVLIFPVGAKPGPSDLARIRMDMALEAPLEATRLIQVLANFTNQDAHLLIERMLKSAANEAANLQARSSGTDGSKDDSVFVTGSGKPTTDSWTTKGSQDLEDFNRLMGVPSTGGAQGKAGDSSPPPGETSQFVTSSPEAPPPGTAVSGTGESASDPLKAPVNVRGEPDFGANIRAQLHQAEVTVHDKVKGYAKYLQKPLSTEKSALKRTDARKAQKELHKDWNDEELKDQDRLRRAFAEGLFKKKD